ncbi:uncharacterized protein BcabD6B2_25460 [Babesia caballi]|uniref:Uncharacterized protein n=1 Tax=Babesia caballi TaxID=5871 RepID=A0AAV4LTE4_BABCB|nr:hypothetical protein BcabD6B2_25460 [Babesia caballi]
MKFWASATMPARSETPATRDPPGLAAVYFEREVITSMPATWPPRLHQGVGVDVAGEELPQVLRVGAHGVPLAVHLVQRGHGVPLGGLQANRQEGDAVDVGVAQGVHQHDGNLDGVALADLADGLSGGHVQVVAVNGGYVARERDGAPRAALQTLEDELVRVRGLVVAGTAGGHARDVAVGVLQGVPRVHRPGKHARAQNDVDAHAFVRSEDGLANHVGGVKLQLALVGLLERAHYLGSFLAHQNPHVVRPLLAYLLVLAHIRAGEVLQQRVVDARVQIGPVARNLVAHEVVVAQTGLAPLHIRGGAIDGDVGGHVLAEARCRLRALVVAGVDLFGVLSANQRYAIPKEALTARGGIFCTKRGSVGLGWIALGGASD